MKVPLGEPEAAAMARALARFDLVSSTLLAVEAVRACGRYGAPYASAAREGLDAVALVPIDDHVVMAAADLKPASMRSLDAIHLATAISLGDELEAFVCYDERLCAAAAECGLAVLAPR